MAGEAVDTVGLGKEDLGKEDKEELVQGDRDTEAEGRESLY